MKKVKVVYQTEFGPSEMVIPFDELARFTRKSRVIDVTEVEEDKWFIERVDRYWFYCGRNRKQYNEVTFWYNPSTLERKETKRTDSFFPYEDYKMPEWCKGITEHRRILDAENY